MELARVQGTNLHLIPATLARILNFPPNIKYVVGSGGARVGKSSLLDMMLKSRVFEVSNTTEPCTYGIHISEPARQADGTYVVYIDTEGTQMGDTSQQVKILTLAHAIASGGGVSLHNEASYGDSGIATIAMLASGKQAIAGLRGDECPTLVLVLRNFDLELSVNRQPATPAQFLEHIISDRGDTNDPDRKVVRDSFPSRLLAVLPRPSPAECACVGGPLPAGAFKEAVDTLQHTLLSVAKPKKIGGVVCNGAMMVAYLEECVRKINTEGVMRMESVVEAAMNVFCSKCAEDVFAEYKNNMAAVVRSLSGNDSTLQSAHAGARAQCVAAYTARTHGALAASVARHAVAVRIDNEYNIYVAKNTAIKETKAREAAAQAAREAQERARVEREAAQRAQRLREEADQRARAEAAARAEAERRRAAEAQRIAEANRRAQEEQRLRAEAEARAQEASRRNNSTHLNGHGFRISGTRIW